jgi:hypothetical protein
MMAYAPATRRNIKKIPSAKVIVTGYFQEISPDSITLRAAQN